MKKVTFFFLLLVSSAIVQAQTCKEIQTGKFRIAPDNVSPNESVITRTAEHQIEEVKSVGLKMRFDLKWTSDCTYELSKPKVLKGEAPWVSEEHKLYVKIIKVAPTFYTAEITSNFADQKLVKDIERMK